jgi:hypothetical protein
MIRKLAAEDLNGKTIQSFDNAAVNVVRLKFTDGSELELWAEEAVSTQFGTIPGIFVEDNT